MTEERYRKRCPQQETWDDYPPIPGRCSYCRSALPRGRSRWCSNDCVRAVRLRVDWGLIRVTILDRDGWRCVLCNNPAWEVDHVHELADGGSFHDPANLRAICTRCHLDKTERCRRARRGLPPQEEPGKPRAHDAVERGHRRRHSRHARDFRGKRAIRAGKRPQDDPDDAA